MVNRWQILRIRGSHHQLGKNTLRTTVPVHGKRDLGTGILKKIEKDTGVKLQ
jgi:predicted RNA binding protein YcfA (HicA-like mRNA interferase family)